MESNTSPNCNFDGLLSKPIHDDEPGTNVLKEKINRLDRGGRTRKKILENVTLRNNGIDEPVIESKKYGIPVDTDHFAMICIDGASKLMELTSANGLRVFIYLAILAEIDTNIFHLTTQARIDAAKTLNIPINSFSNTLLYLGQHNILKNKNGEIFLNPSYVFRGKLSAKKDAIRKWGAL